MLHALTIIVPTVCYLVAAGFYLRSGEPHLALTMVSYGVANLGFLWGILR